MSTTSTDKRNQERKGAAFEPWMFSNFAAGAAISAFAVLLIPSFVIKVTQDASAASIAMAIISLAAVMGSLLGGFADKYGAHRLVLNLGVLGMAVGFALFALADDDTFIMMLGCIPIGVGIAAVSTVAPVFVLSITD